ncbi:hypothetical protein B0F88_103127 [Methylobacter tundripaludum]|uniref:Uncharacterized protein n=1 Tax=Methylobacter tundripaludum TaxID=173365 RepID=A0A2S6H5F6_9GAMM|nr:hypothetical protein [Methylobacter tundripaludum]PPK72694.1 hypothetical protein B0F88_103127 [Methylobacter tundripaludum]
MSNQAQETREILEDVVGRWSPDTGEELNIRMMRALLNLAAFEKDIAAKRAGQQPIRTDYPIDL